MVQLSFPLCLCFSQIRGAKDSKPALNALDMDLESLVWGKGRHRKPRGGRRSAGHRGEAAGEGDIDMGEAEVGHVWGWSECVDTCSATLTITD